MHLPRLQWVEIHEQPWCPPAVREGATDCLNLIAIWGRQYTYITPRLRQAIARTRARRIVDLCSGSGGPWGWLMQQFAAEPPLEIVLTDLFPNPDASPRASRKAGAPRLCYLDEPIDATRLPEDLDGFRTLFTAFHHFPPAQARLILQDAVTQGQGIAIFEQTQRSLLGILAMLALPWIALLAAPFARPLRPSRLFWTYLLPLIPLVLCLDGMVSCLRTYTPAELQRMVCSLDGPEYTWEIGRAPAPLSPLGITYAIGYPRVAVTK